MKTFDVRLRAEITGNMLRGHAAVYDQVAQIPGGYERFAPGAFDEVIDQGQDVVAAIDHDMSKVIGRRSSGTLRLKSDGTGLAFEVDLPSTSYSDDLRELVSRGDITGASVGYIPASDGEVFSRSKDGTNLTTVIRVERLRDVSPVTLPAYVGTDVSLRFEDFGPVSNRSRLIRARARVLSSRFPGKP